METESPLYAEILRHLLTVGGFLLAVFLIARLMSEKRQPGNTVAWLLGIALIPYVGVPLYLLFGGRKLQRLVARKSRLSPVPSAVTAVTSPIATGATAQALVREGGCTPVGGNAVRLLTSGEEAYAEFERRIREARQTIHLMTFILGRDDTGRRIVDLLAQRAREGVKVRLLLDAVGCFLSSRGFVDPIRRAGGEVHRFMPVLPLQWRGSANLRNHRKIAVFDQQSAILGGHNLAVEYMGRPPRKKRWRDFGAVIEGPAVELLNEVFLADWCYASGQPVDKLHAESGAPVIEPRGACELQVVASGPDVTGDPLYEGILSFLQEAKRRIWIITPYFIPDEVIFRSLLVKARTGHEVKLVVPARSNHPIADQARRHYLRELQKAGVQVLLYRPGMMHGKGMIIDDRIGLLGSANFDLRSLFVNFEIGVFVYSEPEVHAMRAWAEELMTHCHPLTAEKPSRRLLGNIAEDVSRLLAPLL
ncbi:MAG: cardiolipin synthase [Opitutaceae bacterium]